MLLGTGRNLRPVQPFGLRARKTEHEIFRETSKVTFYGFVEALGGYLVELGQIGIEHDLVTTDQVDLAFDELDRDHRICSYAPTPSRVLAA